MLSKKLTPQQALRLSVAAATATIAIKWGAWWATGSVGFLSDAPRFRNQPRRRLVRAAMVSYASRPPDSRYPYGYGKAEYFSSLITGILVTVAAAGIFWAAGERLIDPQPAHSLGMGIGLSFAAALMNLAVAQLLLRTGREHSSLATEGDGRHLMSDVYATTGVIVGVGRSRINRIGIGWIQLWRYWWR